ncbi:MAG: molybdopterin converting factor subunit 1 [Gammaproteobacteria bacterium]|nr:molybdopterin converting factor subunit 1 [Gammaproteobacteria bacterium]
MANLLYFASLRETLDSDKEQLDLPDNISNISDLKNLLAERGGSWSAAFTSNTSLLVSVNQQMADDQATIQNSDEIAFFPPVTGG